MSDDEVSDGDGGSPEEPPVEVFELGDEFLAFLVSIVNDTDVEIAITLLVRGTVVTGLLASAPAYYERFGELFSAGFPGASEETRLELRRLFNERAMSYRVPSDAPARIGYVHIKNAQIVDGTVLSPRVSTSWLRLRVSDVSGWILGSMSRSDDG